jgi:hypothetical protein
MNTKRIPTLNMRIDPDVIAQDRRRGHRFQPPADQLRKIPQMYATEATPLDDTVVHLHYFTGPSDWWVAEIDQSTGHAFAAVSLNGNQPEWGYVDLFQLAVTRAGFIGIERDLFWDPKPWRDIKP